MKSGKLYGQITNLMQNQMRNVRKVNTRVSVHVREYEAGKLTNDVIVDGLVYTPAVGDTRLSDILPKIVEIVGSKSDYAHIGMGNWISWSEHAQ